MVLQAGSNAKGGEIFILDMGKPVKILTLAENMIRLSGHIPNDDIKIVFTGLRPGEKIFEELLMSEEGIATTDHKQIFIGKQIDFDETDFLIELEHLRYIVDDEQCDIRSMVKEFVPTFSYADGTDENGDAEKIVPQKATDDKALAFV